jgi:hypothetical protein
MVEEINRSYHVFNYKINLDYFLGCHKDAVTRFKEIKFLITFFNHLNQLLQSMTKNINSTCVNKSTSTSLHFLQMGDRSYATVG